jgi:CRP/FNR family transcriptional regulator, cyclic AMP receptor protein
VTLDRPSSGQAAMDALHWWATVTGEGVEWLHETGRIRLLRRGTVVVHRGEPLDTVFIVLSGRLAIQRSGRSMRDVEAVYPGEILGDALSTETPLSTVTLVAVQDSCVFAVSKARLTVKLGDAAFASRFYRALALLLACSGERRLAQRAAVSRPAPVPVVSSDAAV